VLLNDNFEGGDFNLYNQNKVTLNKMLGNTYIFDVKIEHEITPILKGERYSLLWFLQNEHIKMEINKLI
jgi:predicted 2-oxoglutarate/Fe(II)-dependent dioxygenase YbiX